MKKDLANQEQMFYNGNAEGKDVVTMTYKEKLVLLIREKCDEGTCEKLYTFVARWLKNSGK